MYPRDLIGVASCLLAVTSMSCAALASPSIEQCLEQNDESFVGEAVRETFGFSPPAQYDNIMADARGIVWRPSEALSGSGAARYAAAFDGIDNCWLGGEIAGTDGSAPTARSGIAVGTAHPTGNTEIHSLQISGAFNGVWVGSQTEDLRLTNLLLSENTDTCLIADHRGDLIVDNVLFEQCARVIRLRSESASGTLTVQNSLIRIDNRDDTRGRGELFNRAALQSSVQINFNDNVIITAKSLDKYSLAVIAGNCKNNTLIWLGQDEYPGVLPDCFKVIKDASAWPAARSAWMTQFETQLVEFGTASAPAVVACTVPSVPTSLSPRKTVGNGSAASCTESALRRALTGGGTIVFSCGSSPVNIPIGAELVIASNTVLDGGGKVALDGQNRVRIIRNNSQLTLKSITLRRGRSAVTWNGRPNGGGAVNSSYGRRLYVVDSTFRDNQTSSQGFGGAIFQAGNGALTVVRSRFENNIGGGGGAVYNLLAGLQVVNSTFVNNRGLSGSQGGGGIMTDGASANSGSGGSGGQIVICGSSFSTNTALATGGGAYLYAYSRDQVTVRNSTFTGNSVTPNSGGLSMGGGVRIGASPALIIDSTFRSNTARTGGAIATNSGSRTQVRTTTFECNSSNIAGTGVVTQGNIIRSC